MSGCINIGLLCNGSPHFLSKKLLKKTGWWDTGSIRRHGVDRNGPYEGPASMGNLSYPFSSSAGTFASPE